MLRILGRVSSINVRKVLWTCDELGLPFAREDWGLGFQFTRSPEFLSLNPNALVPVLVDDGFVLWESNTICRYLAARERRTDLLPADARGRACVEQWMDWQAADLNIAWRYAFMALVRRSPAHADAAAIEASVQAWNHQMQILDAQLERTGAFVAGETFTLADITLGLCLHRWQMTPIERPILPAVAAYRERLGQRAGFLQHAAKDTP
ncbi:MAG: glutathione S-transferase [Burkholderiaceae bacterium]